MKTFLLATVAAIALATPAFAFNLTVGAGGSQAVSGGVTASASQSTSGAALAGITAGQTNGSAVSGGAAGASNTTHANGNNASNTSTAGNVQGVATHASNGNVALGLAGTVNQSTTGATQISAGQATGGYFTLQLH